ncbi:hypothetical protein llap_11985 [Limosa lapponica baueri]|uniref:Uncharacterized protein n=1 Tax=Limosa lapponica baueri TaxID=1758121 RepID=A0A2I0TV91_LIMLA|nr:hypothetical protein llap_11985 [Limosa lapponica baueri]
MMHDFWNRDPCGADSCGLLTGILNRLALIAADTATGTQLLAEVLLPAEPPEPFRVHFRLPADCPVPCLHLGDHYPFAWANTGSPVAEVVASNCSKTDIAPSCHEKGCPHTSPLACHYHLPSASGGPVNRFREMDSNKPTLPEEAVLRVVSS